MTPFQPVPRARKMPRSLSMRWRRLGAAGLAVAAAGLLPGCSDRDARADAATLNAPAKSAAPAVAVVTVAAAKRDLPVTIEATGTVAPVTSVEVRAQASSVVERVHVREGQTVRAGDLLFTLDTRADQARVAQAQAALARDRAGLADAQRQLARARELRAQGFVAQGAVDTAQAQVDSLAAVVAAGRASVDAAQVTLGFGVVRAPVAGRTGALLVQRGAAVQANVTPLITVTQVDPIDVAFSVPQRHLPDVLAALPAGVPVQARLPDRAAPVAGRLHFVDNAVNASSGAVAVKARFDNRGGPAGVPVLWPGAFVQVSLELRALRGAVVIPRPAVIQSPKGPIVYVVQGDQATVRPLTIVAAQGDDVAVEGVAVGERVVVDGRANLRPGAKVIERGAGGAREGAAEAPSAGARRPAARASDGGSSPAGHAPAPVPTPVPPRAAP